MAFTAADVIHAKSDRKSTDSVPLRGIGAKTFTKAVFSLSEKSLNELIFILLLELSHLKFQRMHAIVTRPEAQAQGRILAS